MTIKSPKLIFRTAALLMVVCLLMGCVQEKDSLHEHVHDEPEHWPTSMVEAADFIESRVEQLDAADTTSDESIARIVSELKDLVEWSPEIAAESDLAEEDWLPIYEMSEAIRKHFQSGEVGVKDLGSDFKKLCDLLRDASGKLPVEDAAQSQEQSDEPIE